VARASIFAKMGKNLTQKEKQKVLTLIEQKSKTRRRNVKFKVLVEIDPLLDNSDGRIGDYLALIKRKSAYNYYKQELKCNNVAPSDFTVEEIRAEKGEDWLPDHLTDSNTNSDSSSTSVASSICEDDLVEDFENMNIEKKNKAEEGPNTRHVPPPVAFNTPPRRTSATVATPQKTMNSPAQPFPVPLEDLAFDTKPSSSLSNDDSSFIDVENHFVQLPGTFLKPHLFSYTHQGCGLNGYKVYFLQKLYTDEHSYKGLFVQKRVDPLDLIAYSAEVADEIYLKKLFKNGYITKEEAELTGILFKEKFLSTGDTVQDCINYPDEVIKQIEEEQAQVNVDHACYWSYTLCLINLDGRQFDNRVFSNHDLVIKLLPSLPPSEDAPYTGHEEDKQLIWHAMWRVAIKGTAKPINQRKELTIQDLVKAHRK